MCAIEKSLCEIGKSLSEIRESLHIYEKLKLLYENEKLLCEIIITNPERNTAIRLRLIVTVENEKSLYQKKITIGAFRLVCFEPLGLDSQRRVFYLSLVSSPCRRVKMAQQSEHQPRHLLEEVRVLTEQISQRNQSNVSAEVSRVFGRSQGTQGHPSSSINQNASSASSTHFRRIANMRRLSTSSRTNKSTPKAKPKENTPFLCNLT